MLSYLNIKGNKSNTKTIKGLERVLSMAIVDNNELILTGIHKGASNLFRLNGNNAEAITRDKWDVLDATVVNLNGHKGIIFASNRPEAVLHPTQNKSLQNGSLDLFYFDPSNKDGKFDDTGFILK